MEEQHDPDAPEATKHCKVCKSLWFGTDSKMRLRDWEPPMGKANKPSFNKDHSPKCVRLTYPLPKSKPRNCSSRISRLNRDSASVPESSHKLISGTKGMLGASTTAPDPSTPRPPSKRAQSVQPASPPPPLPKRPNVASSPPHKASRQQANRTFTQATIVTSPNSKVYKVQRPPVQPNSKSPAALSSSSPVQRLHNQNQNHLMRHLHQAQDELPKIRSNRHRLLHVQNRNRLLPHLQEAQKCPCL